MYLFLSNNNIYCTSTIICLFQIQKAFTLTCTNTNTSSVSDVWTHMPQLKKGCTLHCPNKRLQIALHTCNWTCAKFSFSIIRDNDNDDIQIQHCSLAYRYRYNISIELFTGNLSLFTPNNPSTSKNIHHVNVFTLLFQCFAGHGHGLWYQPPWNMHIQKIHSVYTVSLPIYKYPQPQAPGTEAEGDSGILPKPKPKLLDKSWSLSDLQYITPRPSAALQETGEGETKWPTMNVRKYGH